mmetsp:Transcript_44752/g.80484  ORF Transcript_44752/g.80484 Transcript_44752/m.80484 type:complete len:139 (+) Transcript_44752:255-671(+)
MECVCRMEMLRDELIEPGESESVPIVMAEEPPHRQKIRSFFAKHEMELLPCTAQAWHHLYQELGMWPGDTVCSDSAVWERLYEQFWTRRAELGAHRLRQEAVSLLARASEAMAYSGIPLPVGSIFERLSEPIESSGAN